MKAKKTLALLLTLAMIFSLFPAVVATAADETDPYTVADAEVTVLKPHVDGKEITVTAYKDTYLAKSNSAEQLVNVYVPENATAASPIILFVNNAGWMMNSYAGCTKVVDYSEELATDRNGNQYHPGDYSSTSNTDKVGASLAAGYVVVSYGCRGRNDAPVDGEYLGHSPATMVDTKGVIRWLRYNDAALPGDAERIVVTGTSGGGALSTVIAASGNSADYFEGMYEVGAAGVTKNADGSYSSSIRDDVWGVIAYCPITDLGNADTAYEWTYGATRERLYADGKMSYNGADEATVMANSKALAEAYPAYVVSLGLKTADGTPVTCDNLRDVIIGLMKTEIEEAVQEVGVAQMRADIESFGEPNNWLKLNDDGTYEYNYDEHLYWLASHTKLKISCAFSNVGTGYGEFMNEDNLFGTKDQVYVPYEFKSWELDATENDVGLDDTGLTWEQFMATDAGKAVAKQMRMTSAVAYLNDDADGDSAPYWYVRHGMADRDTSFAVEAVLALSMANDPTIVDQNFEFTWLRPHSGDYDIQEAFAWLAEKVAEDTDPLSVKDAAVTVLKPHLDGKEITVTKYEDVYCAAPNRAEDQKIALFVPETATAESPIIFMVNNSGWMANTYAGVQNKVETYSEELATDRSGNQYHPGDYVSTSNTDAVGKALAEGYVIAVCGARSRNNGATDGEYLGHSPATMTDTKAAFRWLRYNAADLPAGDPEKIVVTGTSGGGALSVVLSASGDSADYFESLYEIGAAGVTKNADGTYSSTVSDAVWATIAYCPITDLGNACAAYEWTWGEARDELIAEGHELYSGEKAYGLPADEMAAASDELTAMYIEYVDSLGLSTLNSANLRDAIITLMENEIKESISEVGIEQMRADLKGADWLVINDDGSFEYNYDAHVKWVGTQTKYKTAPAFANTGMGDKYVGERNEDNLFGTRDQDYAPFNEYSWNHDAVANSVGLDDTGLTWDQYIKTAEGKALLQEIKMTSPIQYLLSDTDGTSAPNWYVRYGMADRDSSFAVETVLYHSMLRDASIENISFEFAWLKPHAGNYDVQEAYAWLATMLDPEVVVTNQTITVNGVEVETEVYNINGNNYFKLRDIAMLLKDTGSRFSVDYNAETRTAAVKTGGVYVAVGGELATGEDKSDTCVVSDQTITVDGVKVTARAYNIGGNNFFKLRDLGSALNFDVDYDYATRTVIITSR